MSARDIEPHLNGTNPKQFPVAGSQTFRQGEPLLISSNRATEAADDPSQLLGIAADSSLGIDQAALASGELISYYPWDRENTFKTKLFATDGAGTAATPAASSIGDQGGFTLSSGVWTFDTGTDNTLGEVVDVLDPHGVSLADPARVAGVRTTPLTVLIRPF